jgi:hypothetical protein
VATVRIGIELAALVAGVLLGGTAGLGTLLWALGIGPAVGAWFRPPAREDRTGACGRRAWRHGQPVAPRREKGHAAGRYTPLVNTIGSGNWCAAGG